MTSLTVLVSLLYHISKVHVAIRYFRLIDHRRRQIVVRTSVTHSVLPVFHFFVLTTFDLNCYLSLHRCTTTWNLFSNLMCDLSSPGQVWKA